ncbi:alginate lyase-domain-containing protein [Dissophora ornata]|nr:hypothetical protein BGZ58_001716 [Dissophora ornata]KAI8601310.1 alginate lyase-domain-containing protein [Dissophora ornata]
MAHIRGSTKRTLTILVGLCIFAIIFTYTPYPDKALDQLPDYGWRSKTPSEQELRQKKIEDEQRLRQEQYDQTLKQQKEEQLKEDALEKERLRKEQNENDKDVKEVNNDKVLFEETKETTKDGPSENVNEDTEEEEGLEDEEPQDGLPTEFNESLLPRASQKTLEAQIGVKVLDKFIHEGAQTVLERDSAVAYILLQANYAYRNNSVYSVVIKPRSKVAPSGDMHDYTSLARYYWKNPDTPDGLPYVRHDGKPNPDMDTVWDYRLLRKVFRDCYFMGMAYFWTGDERYAEKVVYRVKEWFLDRETYMNPNVKYGSWIFGSEIGRSFGVLDMFKVYGIFDGLKAIKESKALQAEPKLIPDLKLWFTEYMQWIDESVEANQERNARNNHGTFYTVQYISILEFLGRNDKAKALLEEAKELRVGSQIRKDGAQPHETIRPISYFYSTFNLQGLILLAMQADSHGVDLWRHMGPEVVTKVNSRVTVETGGGTVEDAIRYLSDYAVRDLSEWPYPDSGTRNVRDVLKMAKLASLVYGRDRWQEQIENLEAKVDEEVMGEGLVEDVEDDSNAFICELGILSKSSLWHCYK